MQMRSGMADSHDSAGRVAALDRVTARPVLI
jgi:hypothetical protein